MPLSKKKKIEIVLIVITVLIWSAFSSSVSASQQIIPSPTTVFNKLALSWSSFWNSLFSPNRITVPTPTPTSSSSPIPTPPPSTVPSPKGNNSSSPSAPSSPSTTKINTSFSNSQISAIRALFEKFLNEERPSPAQGQSDQSYLASLGQILADISNLKTNFNRHIPQNSFGSGSSQITSLGDSSATVTGSQVTGGNVKIGGNSLTTTSGNLIINSTGGTTTVSDNLTVSGATTFSNTGSHSAAGEWNFNSNTLLIDPGTSNVSIGTTDATSKLTVSNLSTAQGSLLLNQQGNTFVKTIGIDSVTVSALQTSDGGYILGGRTYTYGAGGADNYIAKYDSSGNPLWLKTIGGTDEEHYGGVIQTPDGGYALAGQTKSYGAGDYDTYIAKFDSSGNITWAKTIGSADYEDADGFQQTSDGGYIITANTTNYTEIILMKLDSSANVSWTKKISKVGTYDYVYEMDSIEQTADGGYIMAGARKNGSSSAILVIKFDSSGNLSWSKTISTGSEAGYAGVKQTSDGGYIIGGDTNSFGAGGIDILFVKLDPSGNVSWAKTVGGTGTDYFGGNS